ncbi:MAG TPA: L-seryl-tRNA(Sec) selenium transferase [Terriglobales bacterium]|nr:L-seryl-tRNA(Sec) selenium transferase [Terriglobales bacterium]
MQSLAKAELYRKLPSVDELLRSSDLAALLAQEGQTAVADAARTVLARLRDEIGAGRLDERQLELAVSGIATAIQIQLRQDLGFSLKPVINATGVILHTNLGRAPLSRSVLDHVVEASTAYSNLEFDVASGERGKRDVHVDRLFKKLLTSNESSNQVSTIVVNNNAAAVLLALNSLAEGGEVIVSRGELVEIGGSFRIPDVMTKSNAILREVGTTNRTRISDYERAINEKTRLLLRVHRSNFEISGFTEQPTTDELVALAQKKNIPLLEDLGSGALLDLQTVGIHGEPGVLDSLRAGVDVVTYSGDKLLGGPQAGLLSGRADLISRMRSNSLFRALRVDKMTYAALEATLLAYVKRSYDDIPSLQMMGMAKQEIGTRAAAVASSLPGGNLHVDLIDGESVIGGGSAPSAKLPTRLLAIASRTLSADELARRLRSFRPPIVARVEQGRVLLDLRTVFPAQDATLIKALTHLAG